MLPARCGIPVCNRNVTALCALAASLAVCSYFSGPAVAQFTLPQIELPEISVPDPAPDAAPQYLRRDPWNFSRPAAPPPAPTQTPAEAPTLWDACLKPTDALAAVNACSEFAEDESQPAQRRAEAYFIRARAYEAQNQTIAAIADLGASIEFNPKYPAAYYLRGSLWKHSQNYDLAIKDFSAALALNPKSLQYLIERGVAYRGKKDAKRSFDDLNRALKINPKSELVYYERGLTYLSIQQYAEASADLERALTLNPKFALARFALGNVKHAKRDLTGAIDAYNDAVRIDPSIELYIASARGLAQLEIGNCQGAISDFSKALTLNAKSLSALRNRGICHHRVGMYDEAVADFTRAIYITPSDATLFGERGNSFLYGKDVATAERDITHALKLDPKNATALQSRAHLRIVQKRYQDALADFDAVIAARPSSELRGERLWLFIAAGDLKGAEREIEALLGQSNDAAALFARGYLRVRSGEHASGKKDMIEAVKRDSSLPYRLSIYGLEF